MAMTVLSVAFAFAPVGPKAVGGAEQILTELDGALTAAGHTSLVLACEGSQAAGTLFPTLRTMKSSPGPAFVIRFGTTRESEQVMNSASGRCPASASFSNKRRFEAK